MSIIWNLWSVILKSIWQYNSRPLIKTWIWESCLTTICFRQLDKLKRSYLKLQRKQLKETSGGANPKEAERSEVTQLFISCFLRYPCHLPTDLYCNLLVIWSIIILVPPLQEHQQRSSEWEQQCIQNQKQLAALEAQHKSLTDELTHMKVRAD